MKAFLSAAALSLVLAASAPAALAQSAPDAIFRATTLNLSAFGETRVAPDKAAISLAVVTEAPTAQAALAANATQMTKVMAALKKAAVAPKDIQTSGLNLQAQYDYVENNPPRLRGYQASNQVSVTVRDLARLGAVVDAAVASGVNQVAGISFGVSDPSAAEDAARQAAVKSLTAKSQLYAAATGYKVARLVSLSENGGYSDPSPRPMMAMARMEKMDSTPVAPGEITIRVDLASVYELTR